MYVCMYLPGYERKTCGCPCPLTTAHQCESPRVGESGNPRYGGAGMTDCTRDLLQSCQSTGAELRKKQQLLRLL